MAKKNFAEGIDAVLGGERLSYKTKKESMRIEKKAIIQEEIKTSINMNANLLEKLRAVVYWERTTLKVELENAIKLYLSTKGDSAIENALEQFREKKPSGKIKG
ncbi:MAG: hypothetical protein MK076_10050 [Flavobacteriales bacterium]|jgi:hypothetical protein|nr:hypothetical protein [Flavobacteriales bacterium]